MKNSIRTFLVKKMPITSSKYFFFRTFKKRLNLKNPTTFNEKLMWLKLYEDDSLKIKCADKYLVRDYISKLGYSNLLIDVYKVYENVEEIDFKELPNRFAMKCTHGSGFNIICSDKDQLDQANTLFQLNKWIKTDYGLKYFEPHYSKMKPRVIVEKLLEEELEGSVPVEYMIHCFHGEPQVIEVGIDVGNNKKKYLTFNCDWEPLPYYKDSLISNEAISKPERIEEMIEISSDLSKAFTYVRVDLYSCQNEIYFGELTFTPGACLEKDFIKGADEQMGKLLDLTVLNKRSLPKVSIPQYIKTK